MIRRLFSNRRVQVVSLLLIVLGWGYAIRTSLQWGEQMRQIVEAQHPQFVELQEIREPDLYNVAHLFFQPVTRLIFDNPRVSRSLELAGTPPRRFQLAQLQALDVDQGWIVQYRLYECDLERVTRIEPESVPADFAAFLASPDRRWSPIGPEVSGAGAPIDAHYCPEAF